MKMKFVLFSIYLVSCFFAARAEVKESRVFTLVNSNGDSARCEITSFEPDSVKRAQRLKDGKEKRDGIFNKEDFKKIIEKTELKQYFVCDSPYEKMNSCRLTYKSVPELHQIPPASEDTSLSLADQTPDTNEATKSALDNTDNLTEQKPFPVFYIILVILLLLIIILLIKIVMKKQPEHRNFGRDSIGRNGISPQDDEIAKLKEDVAKLKNDMAGKLNLENDIKYLKEEIERLKKERATSNTAKPDTAQEITAVADSENIAASTDKFFFAGPIDNTFNASRKTADFIDGQSLYRFERIHGSNRAVFAAEGNYESVVQRFVCSPELQAGVCDVIGNYDPNASQIRTDEPGEAVLNGNMWIVDKKAKIRYC